MSDNQKPSKGKSPKESSALLRSAAESQSARDHLIALANESQRNNSSFVTQSYKFSDYIEAARLAIESTAEVRDRAAEVARSFASKEALNSEIRELQAKISEASKKLEGERRKGEQSQDKVRELEGLISELRVKEDLGFLLTRVSAQAQERLIADPSFREMFAEDRNCDAYVMSVDIRRSTELMLKARTPSAFAEFISHLTRELYACVVRNHGVFDKFTGDGILAFFPTDFSGDDAAYLAVKTASECHQIFQKIYKSSRASFTSVLTGVGLGIGVDRGTVRLLRVAEGLTVVGVPVVYACRLSSAKPGQTLLNQPAFEAIGERFASHVSLQETTIDIKHEGEILAYDAKLTDDYAIALPKWMI